MVVKMIKWRPWPPLLSRKFQVKLVVKKMELGSCDPVHEGAGKGYCRAVEIRWKGPKTTFRRTVKRDFTKEVMVLEPNGVVLWDEEFISICTLSGCKENVFYPWEIGFNILNGLSTGPKNKVPVIGTATLNLADYASVAEEKEFELEIPLIVPCGAIEPNPLLHISLSLVELRATQESAESMQSQSQTQSQTTDNSSGEKDELSALKAGLRKVKNFKDYVSIRRAKKTSCEDDHDISESRSEDGDYTNPFDSDSLSEPEENDPHEGKNDISTFRKSFCYGTLANANYASEWFLYENCVYYSHRKSDVGSIQKEDPEASIMEGYLVQNSKRSILPWKKRKLNFKSPKVKGEPLLKKDYGEEGGDDIDFDRRQLSSDESLVEWQKACENSSVYESSISDFGDDNFAVGNWENRDIISRDGYMKLVTQVFFASIDQRSERAAGESACTALVAVIADWFQINHDIMPIKSQLDSLIREGSLEWRTLCENETYKSQFPDKHFDLETVIEANIRPISVVQEKSFVGFFHLEHVEEGKSDFLHGAMSFDSMWDEIIRESDHCSYTEPRVYIVSWNDHFFVLKVEREAFYIIDTLGERLFEGCNQAYILKFDRNTKIYKIPVSDSDPVSVSDQINVSEDLADESVKNSSEFEVFYNGKECCKEYIKNFLAAIPIRELENDMKKGLISSIPVHQRLQIEFHYTRLQVSNPVSPMSSPLVETLAARWKKCNFKGLLVL